MPDAAEITDSEILSLIEQRDGPLSGAVSDPDEPEVDDVDHGHEVKASHSKEDSQDLDTADHEGEDDEEEPVRSEDDEQESEEPDAEDDDEADTGAGREVLEPAASALKEENEALKRQLEKAAPIVLTPTEDNPLSDMTTEGQVMGYVKQMRALRDWCFQNLQGGELTTKEGKVIELDAAQVGRRLSRAEAIISDYAPDRIAYIKELNTSRESARKIYPQLFDAKSEWSKIANSYISRHPAMLHDPNYEMVIGDAIAGMQDRIMKAKNKKASANGNSGTKLTQRAIRPNTAPSSKGSVTKSQKARNDFMQTGNKRDLEAMILATL